MVEHIETECCDCGCGDCEDAGDPSVVTGDPSAVMEDQEAELRGRLKRVEDALQMLAKRRICALMTDVDALERHVLCRDVTTADLKKAGMRALGMDRG